MDDITTKVSHKKYELTYEELSQDPLYGEKEVIYDQDRLKKTISESDKEGISGQKVLDEKLLEVSRNMPSPLHPGVDLKDILNQNSLIQHSGKSSDSFAMKLVRERLNALEKLQNDGGMNEELRRCEVERELLGLRQASLMYKASRFADGQPKNLRHRIVNSLIGMAEEALLQIEDVDDQAVISLGYTASRKNMYDKAKSWGLKGMVKDVKALDSMLTKEICVSDRQEDVNTSAPAKEAFYEAKKLLLSQYDSLIRKLTKEVEDTSRRTEASRDAYRAISEMLLQMRLERMRLKTIIYAEVFEDLRNGYTWENILNKKGAVVSGDDVGKTARRGSVDANMYMFGQTLGVGFYVPYEKGSVSVRNRKTGVTDSRNVSVECAHEKYYSKKEIMAIAGEKKKEVVYAPQTLLDLTSIQLLDLIAGVRDRSQDTLGFKYREKKLGDRFVIELYDVHVLFTEGGFSRVGAEKFNIRGRMGDYRIYDVTKSEDKQFIKMSGYDITLAEKLLAMSEHALIESMSAMGYAATEAEKRALTDRFVMVKRALKKDVDRTIGTSKESEKKRRKKAGKRLYNRIQDDPARNLYLIDRKLIGNGESGVIREREKSRILGWKDVKEEQPLTENEKLARKLNSVSREETKSGRLRRLKKEDIKQQAYKIFFAGASSSLKEIRDRIIYYCSMHTTAADLERLERAKDYEAVFKAHMDALNTETEKYGEDLKHLFSTPEIEAADLTEAEKNDVQAPLEVKEENATKGNVYPEKIKWAKGTELLMDEKYEITLIRSLIKDYREKLTQKKTTLSDEQTQKELLCLQSFEELFDFTKGTLDTVHLLKGAKQLNDAKVHYYDKTTPLKMRDVSSAPVFDHEPCIEDVMQGSLGDCYLLACLGALVEQDPNLIKSMFRDNGDTVTVRIFSDYNTPYYITMKKELPEPSEGGSDQFARGAFWVMYIEKAFAILKGSVSDTRKDYHMLKGGIPSHTLKMLTGVSADDDSSMALFAIGKQLLFQRVENMTDEEIARKQKGNVDSIVNYIIREKEQGKVLVCSTRNDLKTGNTALGLNGEHMGRGFVVQHSYTLIGVDDVDGKKMIRLHNPWGTGRLRYVVQEESDVMVTRWDDMLEPGDFYMTPERFFVLFGFIASCKPGTEEKVEYGKE